MTKQNGGTGRAGRGASGGGIPGLDVRLDARELVDGIREAVEQQLDGIRGARRGHAGAGSARSEQDRVRAAILALLAEAPMHGFELIGTIAERSGGALAPSPGVVYPMLQLLVDEGLLTVDEVGGKRRYSVTPAGAEEAASVEGLPWQDDVEDAAADGGRCGTGHCGTGHGNTGERSELARAGIRFVRAVGQLAVDGTPEQQRLAVEFLDEARRKVYALLAEA